VRNLPIACGILPINCGTPNSNLLVRVPIAYQSTAELLPIECGTPANRVRNSCQSSTNRLPINCGTPANRVRKLLPIECGNSYQPSAELLPINCGRCMAEYKSYVFRINVKYAFWGEIIPLHHSKMKYFTRKSILNK